MKFVLNVKILKIINFVLILLFLGSLYPAAYSLCWFGRENAALSIGFFLGWFMLFAFVNKSFMFKLPNKTFFKIFLISALYQFFRLYVLGDSSGYTLLAEHFLIFIALLMCINSMSQEEIMTYLFKWHYLMLICMILGLSLLVTGYLSLISYHTVNEESGTTIFNYGLFFVKSNPEWIHSPSAFRSGGWYDEPGSLANVLLFLLIYNKLFIKSRKAELIFLIGGVFTLSMAHVIIASAYFLLFYIKKKISSMITILGISVILIVGYSWEPQDDFAKAFKNAIFDRAENVANKKDNSRNYGDALNAFKTYFLTGATLQTLETTFPSATSETIWYNLAQNGLLGSIIFFSPIWFPFVRFAKEKKLTATQLKLLFLLLLNFVQRPDYFYPLYFIFIYYIWYNSNEPKPQYKKNPCF